MRARCIHTRPHVPSVSFRAEQAALAALAEKVPAAQLHLKMANDQIALAQRYAKDGDEDEAVLALHRARYDAELALALAKENGTRAEAEAAREKVKQLRASAGTGNSVPPATP